MKRIFILIAAALFSIGVYAQWTKPVPETIGFYQGSAENSAYMYNKEAGLFFTGGNAWGTQASVASTGLKVYFSQYIEEGGEWDGQTFLFNDSSVSKKAWKNVFFDYDDGTLVGCFVDRGSQPDYFWNIIVADDGSFRLTGSMMNGTFNPESYPDSYFGYDLSTAPATVINGLLDAVNAEDPSMVAVDWAFVTPEAYQVYQEKSAIYTAAMKLGELIEKAEGIGVDASAAKAAYADTASTLEALQTAYDVLNQAIMNAASPEHPEDMDWTGDHTVTAINYVYKAENANVPTTGAFKVSYYENYGMFYVEDLLGYDVYTMNYGGIELKPDANDPHKATLDLSYNTLDYNVDTGIATNLYDISLGTTPIEATLNDDGTVTLGDFAIAAGPYGTAPTTVLASTKKLDTSQWENPMGKGSELQFSTEGSDTTLYYLYNEEAGAFFIEGNAWGTQASYTSEGPGLRVMFVKYVPDGGEWDGKTFIIKNFCLAKDSWKELFIDNDQRIFVDRGSQGDYFWECTRNGDSYRFFGAEMNPVYNCIDYEESYMGIDKSNAENVLFPFLDMYDEGAAENYLVDWKLIPALSSEPNPTNNLIDDASFGFEDGTTGGWKMQGWNNQGAATVVASGWGGSAYCMELAPNGKAGQNYEAQLPYNLETPMKVGQSYKVSFYAKAENEGAEIEFGAEYSPWAAHNKAWDGNMITLTTDWALYELELKVTDDYPADGLNSLHINFGKTNGKVYIDHIVLKEVAAPVTKNTFVLPDLTVSQGSQATLQIGLDNSDEITGFQFDLVLPEGVSVQKDGGDHVVNLSSGRASYRNHNVSSNMQADGSLRVVCSSNSNKVFAGSTGTLVEIPLEISQSIATGSYGVKLKNIELATPALVKYNPTDVVSTMTVESGTSALNVEVQEEVDVPALAYDYALGYEGGQGRYDTSMVEDAIGCSAADATVYGYNPSTGEFVKNGMDVSDGWHAANGDLQSWGEAAFNIQFYNDGTFWYCTMPDVAKPGVTYKASWLLVNPETGDAVRYNFVMKDSKAQDGEELDGIYYLQNVESGEWLGGGNSWGTQASLIKHPNPFCIKIENGKYTIDTFTYDNADCHYLGNMGGLYLDCAVAYWDIDKVDDDIFTLSLDGNYIGYDGTSVVAEFATSNSSATQWRLISKDDMLKNFDEATQSNPVDATFLIQVPNFSRNQAYTARNQSPWTVEAASCNRSGGNNTNNCAESWRSSNGFNVYQTLTDIPNGLYKLDVQGSVCDHAGTFENLAYAYANEQTSAFISSSKWADGTMEDGENSMPAMSESFTAGKYQLEPIFVTVTDGTLRVGVRSSRTDTWAVWDNFELTYLGEINSFAGDLLTADMYHSWSTSGADAEDKGTTDCNYKINDQSASDSVPYGDGNVYYLNYADLTAYSTMEIEFTEGTPRLLFNRDGDYGPLNPEINGSAGMDYVTVGEGIWTIDLAAITKAFGYAHLNCIKGANWANATITRVELFKAEASAPIVAPVKVESIVGTSYETIPAGIEGDIAMEVAEYLGVTKAEEVAMATYDEKGNLVTENGGRGETDGWRNAEGAFVGWGTDGFTYYIMPYAELDNGAWSFGAYVGSAPGAVTAPIDFTQKVRFSANGKSVEFPITLSYVNRSELKIEVQEEVDVPAFAYDYALGYAGGEGKYDTSMVEDAIGCSAADAEVFGFNPSTGEFVRDAMSTYDGWFNPEGTPSDWGTPAAFVVKFYNDGTFWYCVRDDVAKPGVTYRASWLLVNPKTGDAIQYNFVMKDSKAQDGEEFDGIYYLQNVESGEWLGGGNSWGSQASLIKHPNPFYLTLENGKYTIDTFTYNNADCHYLGNMGGLYLDCAVAYWDIDKVDDGVFTLSLDGNYIGYDGTSIVAEFAASDSSATQWRLISKDDMLKNFDEATQSKPVDATFLIQVPNFSRNQAYTARNQSPWTVEAANIQLSGGNNTNNCAESWRSSNGFDVYQTLTDIPNGLYKLDVQGSVCDHAGTFENLAYAYANEQTSAFISSSKWADGTMEDGENSMPAMSESFTAGKYQLEPIFVTVTDGTLRVGVRSSRTDTWAVWDNFELTYLGEINSFTVDVVSENKNKGMVSISSASYDESTHTAAADDEITVTAVPNNGYTFWKWHENGADISYENPYRFTLDGDREIVARFVLLGDVYEDGTVDVADLTEVVGYILRSEIPVGRTMLAADVYKDDSVDVADYTMIAGIILNGTSSEVKSRSAEGACREIVNLQLDIELPATVDLTASQVVSALKQTPLRENHSIMASTLSDGKIRVVVISSDNSPANKAEDALMNITVPSDMRQGVYGIVLRNVVLAYSDYTVKKFDELSSTLSFTAPTSIDGIDGTSATDKQIFDISGRKLDKAVNGVNVINGKKIYNK